MPARKRKPAASPRTATQQSKRQMQQRSTADKTIAIPDRLKHLVKELGGKKHLFELTFPISDLDGVQRLAWGLDLRSESVVVRLEFPDIRKRSSGYALFCVHSSTDREKRFHQYCSTKNEAAKCISNPCSSRSTILTCVLSRDLYGLLGMRCCRDLGIIYDGALKLIQSDPTMRCLICGKEFEVKVYTPTACLDECMNKLDQWPLRARLSCLLSHTKVLDFLLCCIYTAVEGQTRIPNEYGTKSSLLVGCPLQLDKIQPSIDSFPKISDELGLHGLLQSGRRQVALAQRRLLSWLTIRFRGCMISLTRDADLFIQGNGLDGGHQFMLLNSRLERQQAFMGEISKVGVGSVAFHGARAPRAFNIISDALRDMISEPYDIEEAGVFYSDSPGYSCTYTERDVPLKAWKQSHYSGQSWCVLFGLEVALSRIPFYANEHSTRKESSLMIRYIFLLPSSKVWDWEQPAIGEGLDIDQNAMKNAYKVLDRNTLSPRHVGLDFAQRPRGHTALPARRNKQGACP